MRILHVIHSLSGGGAERQLLSLMNTAQSHTDVEMAVFCVHPNNAYIPVKNIFIASTQRRWNLSLFSNLLATIKQFRPHLIHVWLPPAATIPAMVMAIWTRTPVIFSYRNVMSFRRILDTIEFMLALVFARRIISNTPIQTCSTFYRFLYRIKHGTYIPNSVDIPQQKQSFQTSRAIKEFIFVGRITQSKNWQTMVRAFSTLRHRHDWRLTIYGKGEEDGALQRAIADLKLSDKIFQFGFSNKIHEVMTEADALVFPSLYEGMPNALLEAMATGLYVIASDIPANRQIVGNTNCVSWFSTLDAEHLKKCIEDFLDANIDVDLRCRKGLEIVEKYSKKNTLRMHLDVYQTLLNSR